VIDAATLQLLTSKFLIGTLIFIRILGVFSAAPFFKATAIIPQVKIFLAALIAISVTSAFWEDQPVIEFHLWYVTLLVMKEFLLGLIIGFAAHAVFFAARFAGGVIDIEMGYQTAVLFDPSNTTPTLVGEFKDMIALMLFLVLNGHHHIIEAAYVSVRAVPLTTFAMTEATAALLAKYAVTVFILAIKISAPILVALFCTNLALALLARIAPQTNIFILSFQVKVAVGLIMLFISVPMVIYILKWALGSVQQITFEILMSMYPDRVL